jgi:hypothetical protein
VRTDNCSSFTLYLFHHFFSLAPEREGEGEREREGVRADPPEQRTLDVSSAYLISSLPNLSLICIHFFSTVNELVRKKVEKKISAARKKKK